MRQGRSSVGSERLSHIQEVIGSTPIVPTGSRQHFADGFCVLCRLSLPVPVEGDFLGAQGIHLEAGARKDAGVDLIAVVILLEILYGYKDFSLVNAHCSSASLRAEIPTW